MKIPIGANHLEVYKAAKKQRVKIQSRAAMEEYAQQQLFLSGAMDMMEVAEEMAKALRELVECDKTSGTHAYHAFINCQKALNKYDLLNQKIDDGK